MQPESSVWCTKRSNIKHQNYGSSTSTESPKQHKHKTQRLPNKTIIQGEFILDYPSFGIPRLCTEIAKRAHRACQVLLQAPELRIVVVSWWDTTTTTTTSAAKSRSADSRGGGDGEEWRSDVLAPLRMLVDGKEKEKEKKKNSDSYSKRRLRFEVGSVNSAEEFGREEFADALRGVVGEEGMVEGRNLGK